MFIFDIFNLLFYQPLFNLLVATYNIMDLATRGHADMGVAVIAFTIIFRLLWLPISFASDRSEKEKREIADLVQKYKKDYADDPVKQKKEIKNLFRTKRGPVAASAFDLFFQILIAIMLYRMFSTGLEGSDFPLLYKFIPAPTKPFNLMFLGVFDLSQPNVFLNVIQSLFILLAEIIAAWSSPFPQSRSDFMTIVFLPILSYFFFMFMPAGKKLFVIATLGFSIVFMLVKQIVFLYHNLGDRLNTFIATKSVQKT